MKKQTLFALFLAIALPLHVSAQPPEEVPPPPPDATEAGEVTVAPAPPAAQKPAAAKIPVVEPKPVAAATAPEDKTVKGVTVSPSIGLYPIGYDRINIGESAGSPEGGRMFFRLLPGVGISSAFKTDSGKTVNFSAAYSLDWREYYNKETTKRDFDNAIEGSVSMEITPILSATIPASFDYFYKAGADTENDNALLLDLTPALNIKANDQFTFKIGYWLRYVNLFDSPIDPSNAPSDIEDLRTGSYSTDASGIDSFGPSFFNTSTGTGVPTDSKEALWFSNSTVVLGAVYKPMAGTSIALDYKFAFAGFSNTDEQIWKGHYIVPKISQDMPWKGGTLSLSDELRIRRFDYATTTAGSTKKDFRNRLNFQASQAINNYFGVEAFYRFQVSGKNEDDYANPEYRHWFYTGVTFKF